MEPFQPQSDVWTLFQVHWEAIDGMGVRGLCRRVTSSDLPSRKIILVVVWRRGGGKRKTKKDNGGLDWGDGRGDSVKQNALGEFGK